MRESDIKYKRAWEHAIKWLENQDPRRSTPREMEIEKYMLQFMKNIANIYELEKPEEVNDGNSQSKDIRTERV
jgi:hypothetical protein